uniref:V-A5-ORF1 n=1 Tax=Glypta fumiferanae TaxID=389681 RepID=A0A0F6Q770_9HYME|nr:V-A5-ORF1 [Glypta fumiferanae]
MNNDTYFALPGLSTDPPVLTVINEEKLKKPSIRNKFGNRNNVMSTLPEKLHNLESINLEEDTVECREHGKCEGKNHRCETRNKNIACDYELWVLRILCILLAVTVILLIFFPRVQIVQENFT